MNAFAKRAAGASLAALDAVSATAMAVRAFRFRLPSEEPRDPEPVDVDLDGAVDCLSRLIRCKTVSYADRGLEDDAEFEKLVSLLPELYPCVFEACTLTRMEGRALLFKWPGNEPGRPAILMSHYDVVPADAGSWDHDPFCGEVFDGALWGRGALDTKVTLNGIPTAASVTANIRIAPGDTVDDVLAYLSDTIDDERVGISLLDASEPSRVSDTDCEGYRRVARAAADTWTDCIVSPSLMKARSDSRHYGSVSDRVYRFSAYDITVEEAATVHGDNERERLDALRRSVEFFTRLLLQC